MTTYFMTSEAVDQVKNWNPAQVTAFVMGSRKASAYVVGCYISVALAKQHAKRIGGVVRMGRIVFGLFPYAETM